MASHIEATMDAKIAKFDVSLSKYASPGPIFGTIIFHSNARDNKPSLNIVGYVEGDFIAMPPEVQFPTEPTTQPVSVNLTLSPHAHVRFLPRLRAGSDSALVEVHIRSNSKTSATIEFILHRKAAHAGINKGHIILIDSAGETALTIPYRFIWLN